MADSRLYKVGLTVAGNYVHGTQYDILTQVFYEEDGCSYVSIKQNQNVRPGTDPTTWVKSSARGAKGDDGVGSDGKSAYQVWLDAGNVGDVSAFLASLKGNDGATPDFSIGTVSTGAAGSQASASITGTAAAPVLNLVIPKGDKGDDGEPGAAGADGQPGEDGVGFESIATPTTTDGTATITLTNGDTITLDLNHQHAQYPKYVYLTSESQMPASPESDTLYLIFESN